MLVSEIAVSVDRRDHHPLGSALHVNDPQLIRLLESFGFDHTCADLVAWLPAIELAWLDGMTRAEHDRLCQLIHARHPVLSQRAAELLKDWLRRRPSNALFRTARRVLRAQIRELPSDERPALRARILGPCVDVGEVSGGIWRFRTLSEREREWLEQFAHSLQDIRRSARQQEANREVPGL